LLDFSSWVLKTGKGKGRAAKRAALRGEADQLEKAAGGETIGLIMSMGSFPDRARAAGFVVLVGGGGWIDLDPACPDDPEAPPRMPSSRRLIAVIKQKIRSDGRADLPVEEIIGRLVALFPATDSERIRAAFIEELAALKSKPSARRHDDDGYMPF
jgi:hypothetical protein